MTICGSKTIKEWQSATAPAVVERFEPAARGKVYQTDLKSLGVTEYGDILNRHSGGRAVPDRHAPHRRVRVLRERIGCPIVPSRERPVPTHAAELTVAFHPQDFGSATCCDHSSRHA
jgi:hypothetical protein